MFEIYYINKFYPERGEIFYKQFRTRKEAEEACYHANQYSKYHGCFYWIEELV